MIAPTTGGLHLSNSRTAAAISDTSSRAARATRMAPAGIWIIAMGSAEDSNGGAALSTMAGLLGGGGGPPPGGGFLVVCRVVGGGGRGPPAEGVGAGRPHDSVPAASSSRR